jgi:hypothetical protein
MQVARISGLGELRRFSSDRHKRRITEGWLPVNSDPSRKTIIRDVK